MVWGAISVHGTIRLHIVVDILNQIKYIKNLNGLMLPQIS